MKVTKKKGNGCFLLAEDKAAKGKLYIILAILGVVAYSLYCFAIMPLYNALAVNYEIGLVKPVLFELGRFGARLFDALAVMLTGSIVIYSVCRFSASKSVGISLIFVGLGVYKYTASAVAQWIDSGYIPSDFLLQIILAIAEAVIWMLPFVAVFFIVNAIVKSLKKSENGNGENGGFACLIWSAAVLSLTVLIVNAGGQLIYDIFTLERIIDPWLMLWDYFSHALISVVGFGASILLILVLEKCFGIEKNKV